jgi:hypothetical protein
MLTLAPERTCDSATATQTLCCPHTAVARCCLSRSLSLSLSLSFSLSVCRSTRGQARGATTTQRPACFDVLWSRSARTCLLRGSHFPSRSGELPMASRQRVCLSAADTHFARTVSFVSAHHSNFARTGAERTCWTISRDARKNEHSGLGKNSRCSQLQCSRVQCVVDVSALRAACVFLLEQCG